MPDKQLTESAWKAFAKGKTFKDDALVKALAALAKSEKGSPADQIDALDALDKQAEALRKAHKGDKDLTSYLDDLDKAGTRHRKDLDAAIKAQAKADAKAEAKAKADSSDDDDEADTPVLLTKKMVPLLRALRKGEERMHAMVCLAGKATAVLIMRRPIAVSRRKLLAESLDAKGTPKYLVGECVFEDGALTFILAASVGGLSKRLRMALFDQTELRFKVRVRGDDGEESDGEDAPAEAPAEGEADAGAPRKPTAAPTAEASTSPEPTAADQAKAYAERFKAIGKRVVQALKAGHPEGAKLKALLGFATDKADKQGDIAAAGKSLDLLEKLLDAATPEPTPGRTPEPEPTASGPTEKDVRERVNALGLKLRELARHPDFERLRERFTAAANALRSKDHAAADALLDQVEPDITQALSGARGGAGQADSGPSLRQMAQAALAWREACARARSEVAAIQAGVIAELEAEDEWGADEIEAVRTELERLNGVFDTLKPQLGDLIDTVIGLSADKRKPALAQVLAVVKRSQGQISSDPMIEAARNNGVHDVDLATPALAALTTLQAAIEPMLAA